VHGFSHSNLPFAVMGWLNADLQHGQVQPPFPSMGAAVGNSLANSSGVNSAGGIRLHSPNAVTSDMSKHA